MIKAVNFEHNLENHELEEVLEKALRAVRKENCPERSFREPFLAALAKHSMAAYSRQISRMQKDIGRLIDKAEGGGA
jgi:hypothetical protein